MKVEATVTHRGELYRGTLYMSQFGTVVTTALLALEGPHRASGYGTSRRMPTDKNEPRVGRRYAVQRATKGALQNLQAQGVTAGPEADGWIRLYRELGARARAVTTHTLKVNRLPAAFVPLAYELRGSPAALRAVRNLLAKRDVAFAQPDHTTVAVPRGSLTMLKSLLPAEFRLVDHQGAEVWSRDLAAWGEP